MIIRAKGGAYYVNGPFAEVHKNLDVFNCNVYFAYLMLRALMDEVDAQQFYVEAKELGDTAIIIEAEKDLAHVENAFRKACLVIGHYEDFLT